MKKLSKYTKIGIVGALLLITVPTILIMVGFQVTKPKPNLLVKRMNDAGLPTRKTIMSGIRVADSENSYSDIVELQKMIRNDTKRYERINEIARELENTPDKAKFAQRLLDETQVFEPILNRIAAKKQLQTADPFDYPALQKDERLWIVRRATIIKGQRALAFAALGRDVEAIESLVACKGIAEQLSRTITLLGATHYSGSINVFHRFGLAVAQRSTSPETRAKIRKLFHEVQPLDYRVAFRGQPWLIKALLLNSRPPHQKYLHFSDMDEGDSTMTALALTQGIWETKFVDQYIKFYRDVQQSKDNDEVVTKIRDFSKWSTGNSPQQLFAYIACYYEGYITHVDSMEPKRALAQIALDCIESGKEPDPEKYRDPKTKRKPLLKRLPNGWALFYPGYDRKISGEYTMKNGQYNAVNDIAMFYSDGRYRIIGK